MFQIYIKPCAAPILSWRFLSTYSPRANTLTASSCLRRPNFNYNINTYGKPITTVNGASSVVACREISYDRDKQISDKLFSYVHHDVDENDATVEKLFEGLIKGQRVSLAQCITLVETTHLRKKAQAQVLMRKVLQFNNTAQKRHSLHRPNTLRIGIGF